MVSVGYCLNRVGDLLGHRMMHHVPCPRYQLELAVRDLLVKPDGLAADIHDLVVAAGHDHHGQAQLAIAVPHRCRLASHAGAILGLGSDLQWPNRHAALEALLEALRHRQRREHSLEQQRQGCRTEQRRDRVAQHIAENGHGRGRDQQRIGPHGRVIVARHQNQAAHRRWIGKRERQGGKCPPGMANHHRVALDAEPCQRTADEVGLRCGGPCRVARAVAVAIARPVEGDDAVPPRGELVEHAAQDPVLGGHHIAVEQHDRRSGALLEVVQPDSIDLDEASGGRVPALDLTGVVAVVEGGCTSAAAAVPRTTPARDHPGALGLDLARNARAVMIFS